MTEPDDDIEKRPPPPTQPSPTWELPAPRRHSRWLQVMVVLAVVIVLAVIVASRVNLNYYALQPGTAQSVQQFITVPADKAHPVARPVKLTDVEESRVSALSYLFFKTQSDTSLYPLDEITGGTPASELDAQGNLEMSQAEAAAKAAALRRLGYTVPATPAGAAVSGTFDGTPASGALNVGDVVTAVDGSSTSTAEALTAALKKYHSGDIVILSVAKGGSGRPQPLSIRLKTTTVNLGGGQTATVDLGVEVEDQVDFTYPFPVTIDVTNIGGPSAGLAMTLGVIDTLSGGDLTGKQDVAATGTIDEQGDVGDVGGVAQKTVAVERAGATIFLVPPQEYGAACRRTPLSCTSMPCRRSTRPYRSWPITAGTFRRNLPWLKRLRRDEPFDMAAVVGSSLCLRITGCPSRRHRPCRPTRWLAIHSERFAEGSMSPRCVPISMPCPMPWLPRPNERWSSVVKWQMPSIELPTPFWTKRP